MFEPSVINALHSFKSVEALILVAVSVNEAFTVIDLVMLFIPQLLATEYEITAVPELTPVTIPVLLTVATDVLLLLQVPPLDPPLRVKVTDDPVQTEDGPLRLPGFAARLTAIILEELDVPQLLETV